MSLKAGQFKIVTNAEFIPTFGIVKLIIPVGVSASVKGKAVVQNPLGSASFLPADFSSNGVYATGTALEMFNTLPCEFSAVTITGTAVVYFG